MATWDDVGRIASALPESEAGTSHGSPAWKVRGRQFVWLRPLTGPDRAALGAGAPTGPIVGLATADVHEQRALVHGEPDAFFVTPHFEGYAAVLLRLDAVSADRLREAVLTSWSVRAPRELVARFLEDLERPS